MLYVSLFVRIKSIFLSRNVRALRASGGIGIFVKDKIIQIFTVTIIDNTFDGILGIALTHKWSGVRVTDMGV